MKIKQLLLLGIPFVLIIGFSLILQLTVLSQPDKIAGWLSSFGPSLILVYIILQTITIVIPPLGGLFLQIALLAVLGPFWGLVLTYLVVTPLYLVNFYIARRFGRPFIKRIAGKTAVARIDHYSRDVGTPALVILKVFQGGLFDYISYAAGLTQIPFKKFLVVNVLGGIPGTIIGYRILTSFDNFTAGIVTLVITGYLFIGISIFVNHVLKKHKKI